MNTKKILLSVLICLVMVATLCLSVACNTETKLDLSDATQWGPAVAEGEEDIYRVSNADGNLVMDFAKNDTYNATKITFDAFSLNDLAKAHTIVITAKMTTNAPYPALLFKVEGTADPANAEVKVKATEDFTTYEWDFAGYDLTKVTRFLIFADPGVAGSSGKITISEIYLTSKEVTAANDATTKPAEVGVAPDPIWTEVTATKMSVGSWVDGTPNNVYTVTANNDGSYKVDVHKNIGAGSYDALVSYVYGNALATAKSFKLIVKGTAGKQILVKPFDSFEKRVTLTGGDDEIIIDVSTYNKDNDKDFSKKEAPTGENKVVIMGVPDTNVGTDTFTIISAEFSTQEVAKDDPTTNTISGIKLSFGKWEDNGDKVYTVTEANGVYTIAYDKGDKEYPAVGAKVAGELTGITAVKFVVKGTAGKSALIKPFDAFETRVDFDGTEQTITIPITGTYNINNKMIIMAEGGTKEAKGSFQIISAEIVKANLNVITSTDKKVTKWYSTEDVYTITAGQNGAVEIAKSAAGWQQLKADVAGTVLGNMKTFRMTVKGINGENLIVKPFDKVEAKYEPAGQDEITIIIDLTGVTDVDYSSTLSILIFYQFGDNNPAASFTIVSAEFSTEAAPAA